MGFCSLPPPHFDEYSSYGVSVTSQSSSEKQNGSAGKESACNVGDSREAGLIPGSGISPGEGNSNTLQYSCLEKPHEQRTLVGYHSKGRKELDTTE